ncbi:hypothetical protein BCR44DRAFT_168735 [Catenaria anguillulae PL171]|uniref:Uncharacterized protein n=1 Tax=Catenaria anguillulae PL171 TaxID=765915 RepID=A0A1Y2HEE8_9FUNG|nr:hypothetical protein BCR44DRAFT_168735 [Catenaria anguillulae PL171]
MAADDLHAMHAEHDNLDAHTYFCNDSGMMESKRADSEVGAYKVESAPNNGEAVTHKLHQEAGEWVASEPESTAYTRTGSTTTATVGAAMACHNVEPKETGMPSGSSVVVGLATTMDEFAGDLVEHNRIRSSTSTTMTGTESDSGEIKNDGAAAQEQQTPVMRPDGDSKGVNFGRGHVDGEDHAVADKHVNAPAGWIELGTGLGRAAQEVSSTPGSVGLVHEQELDPNPTVAASRTIPVTSPLVSVSVSQEVGGIVDKLVYAAVPMAPVPVRELVSRPAAATNIAQPNGPTPAPVNVGSVPEHAPKEKTMAARNDHERRDSGNGGEPESVAANVDVGGASRRRGRGGLLAIVKGAARRLLGKPDKSPAIHTNAEPAPATPPKKNVRHDPRYVCCHARARRSQARIAADESIARNDAPCPQVGIHV